MTEILARISATNGIELVNERSEKIEGAGTLTPHEAAYLARGMLACAAALSGANPPTTGALGGDAHFPVMQWKVGASAFNGEPLLLITIPSGIELTFQMPPQGAIQMGVALVNRGQGTEPLGLQSGSIH